MQLTPTRSVILVSVAIAALCGCTSVPMEQRGREFDPKTFETRVQRGVTTQLQVHSWLGSPSAMGVTVDPQGARFEEWTYYYGKAADAKTHDALKVLQIKFDRQGLVRAYSWLKTNGR